MPHSVRRLLNDRSGNFALVSSIVTIPLLLAAGMAIDVSNVVSTRAKLQDSVDAAVLGLAREGKDLPPTRASEIARQIIEGNYQGKASALTVTQDGTQYKVQATADADLAFGSLLGKSKWPVSVAATSDIAYAAYEVGLVLDTTGSMAGGKLVAMKDAVSGLIDTMSGQVTDKDKLKFALIPFSSYVNVGKEYGPKFDASGKQIPGTGASWLDTSGISPVTQKELPKGLSRFQVANFVGQPWAGCVETRPITSKVSYGTDDTLPTQANPESLFIPIFAPDEEDIGYPNSYFLGAVKTNDESDGAMPKKMRKYGIPVKGNGQVLPYGQTTLLSLNGLTRWTKMVPMFGPSGVGTYDKGPNFGCVSQPITPLTNDYSALKTKVSQLQAAGNTNIMEGVAWGMRVLSPGEPFTDGKDPDSVGVQKMLIVLTDGSNTFGNTNTELGSIYTSFGYLVDGRLGISSGGTSATNSEMNKHTLAACAAAKDAGMEVYTIRLEEPNVTTGTMLQECASSPDHYFDVPSRSKLDEAFSKIRDKIVRVRISS